MKTDKEDEDGEDEDSIMAIRYHDDLTVKMSTIINKAFNKRIDRLE